MFRSNYFIWDPPQNTQAEKDISFSKIGLIIYHSKALLKFFKMKLRINEWKCICNELFDFQILHYQGICKRKTRKIQTFLDVYPYLKSVFSYFYLKMLLQSWKCNLSQNTLTLWTSMLLYSAYCTGGPT